ncbi:hypothetical protein CEP51_013488 [Fusarium floridanum]|uniref:Uncharacterized protein n=1 Tax=Fusarium floridanum TaxID=1325733 RepID=A0A428QAS5_9HYPO|nr:hypothetical protein CEP51_013488 [Fusarium floridanum]
MALPVEPFQMTSPVEAASILLNSLGLGLFVPVLRPLYRYLTLLGINPLALIAVLVTPWIMWKAATRYLMITVEISPGELSPAVQHLSTARRLTGDNMIATLERTAESKPRLSPENPGNNRAVSWWSTWFGFGQMVHSSTTKDEKSQSIIMMLQRSAWSTLCRALATQLNPSRNFSELQ